MLEQTSRSTVRARSVGFNRNLRELRVFVISEGGGQHAQADQRLICLRLTPRDGVFSLRGGVRDSAQA